MKAVVAVSANDGSMVWTRELLRTCLDQRARVSTQTNFIINSGRRHSLRREQSVLLALDAETGSEIWRFIIPKEQRHYQRDDRVRQHSVPKRLSGHIVCTHPGSGTEHWRTAQTRCISRGACWWLFGSHTSRGTIAIDAKSGASLWSFPTSQVMQS